MSEALDEGNRACCLPIALKILSVEAKLGWSDVDEILAFAATMRRELRCQLGHMILSRDLGSLFTCLLSRHRI